MDFAHLKETHFPLLLRPVDIRYFTDHLCASLKAVLVELLTNTWHFLLITRRSKPKLWLCINLTLKSSTQQRFDIQPMSKLNNSIAWRQVTRQKYDFFLSNSYLRFIYYFIANPVRWLNTPFSLTFRKWTHIWPKPLSYVFLHMCSFLL